MKNLMLKSFFVSMVVAFFNCSFASSITGSISYSGTPFGKVFVAAFTNPNLEGDVIPVQMDFPGAYEITDLPDGVYYIVSVMTESSTENFKKTDPWGVYGTWGNLTAVTVSNGNNVSSVDIALIDGTDENPNPFYRSYIEPAQTFQLPEMTASGNGHSLSTDGTSIYLYRHDYTDAPSAKVYKIDPSNGAVLHTYFMNLNYFPNQICWIDKMTFHKGEFWATGGYGDPAGNGWIEGIFKINIETSASSYQLPKDSATNLDGLASDGTYLYAGIAAADSKGIVKFDPALVSSVPSSITFVLEDSPNYLSYGNNCIWYSYNGVKEINPNDGSNLGSYNLPPSAAELYLNNLFWEFDEDLNTLNTYSLEVAGDVNDKNVLSSAEFKLYQNYPNPFNPSTTITFGITSSSFVTLKVFNALGDEVASLVSEELSAGNYSKQWNAQNEPSGIYFYQLRAGSFSETKKLILLK